MQISDDNQQTVDQYKEAMNLYYQGKYEEASIIFNNIVNQDNNNHKARNALGVCLKKQGNLKQANECFKNAVYLAPDNAKYKRNLDIVLSDAKEKKPNTDSSGKDHKKTQKVRSYKPDKTDTVCLFLGLFLLGVYFFSLISGSIIISPARELIGICGVFFFFFFVSINVFKMFVGVEIPWKLIFFLAIFIAGILLFAKFILDQHGVR